MGQLKQTSAVPDSYLLSASVWYFCPSDSTSNFLFQFGDASATQYSGGLIMVSSLGDDYLNFFIGSVDGGASFDSFDSSNVPDPGNPTLGDGFISMRSTNLASGSVLRGKWVHAFMALDMNTTAVYNSGASTLPAFVDYYAPKCALWVNGANRLLTDSTILSPPITYYVQSGGTFGAGAGNVNLVSPDLGPGITHYTINPWQLPINGFELALPAQTQEIGFYSLLRMAEVKIWFNQYIDPAVHISKFIAAGKPVDPAAAISAFGTPAYHFRRNSKLNKKFEINTGTGGSMTKVGTIKDYSPGPGG